MDSVLHAIDVAGEISHLAAPFVLLAACLVLWLRGKSGWRVVALVGAVLAVVGHVAHIIPLKVSIATMGNGIRLTGETTVFAWLAYTVFLNVGLLVSSIGLLGHFLWGSSPKQSATSQETPPK